MVLSAWSLDDGKDAGRPARGGASGGGGGDSREERFRQLAQPALDRLNEQRVAAGQDELVALPPDEEARIWQQVDAGVGDGATNGGGASRPGQRGRQPAGIRSWGDFKTALGNDMVDSSVGWLGMDSAELMGSAAATTAAQPAPAAATATQSAPAAAAAANTAAPAAQAGAPAGTNPDALAAGAHAEHPAIDTDRLDLDELTTRLYDRIRSRLRLELLLDRERAGLLSDFR
jgi:hypothetical protein